MINGLVYPNNWIIINKKMVEVEGKKVIKFRHTFNSSLKQVSLNSYVHPFLPDYEIVERGAYTLQKTVLEEVFKELN